MAEERTQETEIEKESEKLAEGYREIYEAAAEEGTLDTLETKQQILSCLEKEGYAAVDREDQLDMVNSDKMEPFVWMHRPGNRQKWCCYPSSKRVVLCVMI